MPFSSDIGVTAFESSAYGRCSWASRNVDRTNGFRSPPGGPTKRPRPFLIVNWWLPRLLRRRLNGEPGRLRLAWNYNKADHRFSLSLFSSFSRKAWTSRDTRLREQGGFLLVLFPRNINPLRPGVAIVWAFKICLQGRMSSQWPHSKFLFALTIRNYVISRLVDLSLGLETTAQEEEEYVLNIG